MIIQVGSKIKAMSFFHLNFVLVEQPKIVLN